MMLDGDRKKELARESAMEIGEMGRWKRRGGGRESGCHLYVSARVRLSVKIKRRTHGLTDRRGQERQDSRGEDWIGQQA